VAVFEGISVINEKEQSPGVVLLTFLVFMQVLTLSMFMLLDQGGLQRQMGKNFFENAKEIMFAKSILNGLVLRFITKMNIQQVPCYESEKIFSSDQWLDSANGTVKKFCLNQNKTYRWQYGIESMVINPCQMIDGYPSHYFRITLQIFPITMRFADIILQATIAVPDKSAKVICQSNFYRTITSGLQSWRRLK
jgi:hypothetical protein